MPRKTPTITDYTVDDIGRTLELQSYWFGNKWCPAVHPDGDGYSIRIGWPTGNGWKFDYFRLDAEGVIQASPRGYARDYTKRARITDIAEVAERMTTPDPTAHRFTF